MKYFAQVLIGILCLTSCTSVKQLVVDVERPPALILPNNIKNLTVVNNAVIQPQNVGHKELVLGREINSEISVPNDSIDIILMESLGNNLNNTNLFESVYLYEYPSRTDNNYLETEPLSEEKLREIGKETNADGILSIDKIFFETNTNSIPAYDYDLDSFNTLDLEINCKLRYYSNLGKPISSEVEVKDTVFWIEGVVLGRIIGDPNPSRENALKVGAELLGDLISSKITNNKESVVRQYYGDTKTATKLAEENKWTEATNEWMNAFSKENNHKKKARIANNIALGYELTDNIEEALKWINTAVDLFSEEQKTSIDYEYLNTAKSYREELKQRLEDFKTLDSLR